MGIQDLKSFFLCLKPLFFLSKIDFWLTLKNVHTPLNILRDTIRRILNLTFMSTQINNICDEFSVNMMIYYQFMIDLWSYYGINSKSRYNFIVYICIFGCC